MGRSPGGNCFLRRIGRDKPNRAVVLYDDKTKERSTNTFYYRGGGLKPSTVICEQVSTVSTDRVGELIGECSTEEMQLLDQCLHKSLGLKEEQNTSVDTEKLKRERDLYKDLYERLSNEILGK